jgi:hypothetical protein
MNAYVVPTTGGDARQVSWLANTRATSLSWSKDGEFLLLDTGMRTEPGSLARVDLLPFSPKFREDQFTAMFRDETPGSHDAASAHAGASGHRLDEARFVNHEARRSARRADRVRRHQDATQHGSGRRRCRASRR